MFGNLCLVFHYKSCHTWSQTNGPTQNCLNANYQSDDEIEEVEAEEKIHNSSLCCLSNNKCNQDTENPEPILYCISNLCCSKKPYKISLDKNFLKYDPLAKKTDSRALENSNGIEMRAYSEPLLANDTSRQELIR